MKKKPILCPFLAFLFISFTTLYAENKDINCHISLVENNVYIIKSDKDQVKKAVVNYPLFSGDTLYTNDNAKCEIQFGNGTILRMDKHTELRLTSILSPSLTTNKKITTLHLNKGHIYTMNQVYGKEIFQIITPAASLKMHTRSTNSILVNKNSQTHIYVVRGKVSVLHDGNLAYQKHEKIRAKEGCWIKDGHKPVRDNQKQNLDFLIWNDYINRNFKKLHDGISMIPRIIYRRSPGIIHFAERFSTKFGTWVYHELFGYVWKPGDFVFHGNRPFWDANYITINGELFLIPNQPWGWAPAHLGTWFWSKTHGWIWIPGDAFSSGICAIGLIPWTSTCLNGNGLWLHQPQLRCLIDRIYGSSYLYELYRLRGTKAWRLAYQKRYHKKPPHKKPYLKHVPANLKEIIKRVNQIPVQKVVQYVKVNTPMFRTTPELIPVKMLQNRVVKTELPQKLKSSIKNRSKMSKYSDRVILSINRDWNPDSKWTRKTGIRLFYSMKKNQVVCPELKLNSRNITHYQKGYLKRSVINQKHGWFGNGYLYVNPSSTSYTTKQSNSSSARTNTQTTYAGSSNKHQNKSAGKIK
jgi:hypothetical protein